MIIRYPARSAFTALLFPLLLVLTSPDASEAASVPGSLPRADTPATPPAAVAAAHLSRADRALLRALGLQDRAAAASGDAKADKLEKSAMNAFRRAERAAGQAIASGADLNRALILRGTARIHLGKGEGARSDCFQAMFYGGNTVDAMDCYARANLLLDMGILALGVWSSFSEEGGLDPERGEALLQAIRQWIAEDPTGEPQREAARWLADRGHS